jgi:hypothetical protein
MRVLHVRSTSIARRCCWLAAAAILPLLLNACAIQKSYRFTTKSVTKISYNPRSCTELPDGRYKCKDVVFTVSAIEPSNLK